MKSSRALFHLCASPNAPVGEDCGSGAMRTSFAEPGEAAKCLFSPFSPMDSQNQENTSTTTPRRKLSLEMDENAQSPFSSEQDASYGYDSLGSNSSSSLGEATDTSTGVTNQPLRTPLGEIKLSAVSFNNGSQRRTLLARRLMKRASIESSKENVSVSSKDGSSEAFTFSKPFHLAQHRPSSLPTLPLSPLALEQSSSPSSCGEGGMLTRSLQTSACKNLIKQISSPLEKMSLASPFSGVRGPFPPQRSSSVASSTHTEAFSDGYFSEVFEGDEIEDTAQLSDTLTTLINAPISNPSTTANSKPTCSFQIGAMKDGQVCPTLPPPSLPHHGHGFFRSESWCAASPSASSRVGREEISKRGSLKRASPCNEIDQMHRSKRRPPLPFADFSSNSQDSIPSASTKPLKGTPLLRSHSCCVPPNDHLLSPTSPGCGDDFNKIGDFSKPYALPLVSGGSAHDLKCISPETLSRLMAGEYSDVVTSFTIIDCRFPYEYNGGHIASAINIWQKDQLHKYFFEDPQYPTEHGRSIYIFHCEFSSKRGPQMSRFLRETDRRKNGMNFPSLYYPELYLLEGGYRAFFNNHRNLCEPQSYRQMLDEQHREELRHCKLRSKSWNGDCHPRRRPHLRNRKSVFITNDKDASNSTLNESACSRTFSSPTPSHPGGHSYGAM